MAANPSDAKQHAHQLLDRLDSGRLAAVVHLLEVFLDEDSDSLSPAEAKAIAEADEWSQHNDPIPHEQVLADLGLTMDGWEKIGREPLPEETPQRDGQEYRLDRAGQG